MSAKTSGRIIGALLLTAFLAYGGGSALVDSVTGTTVVLTGVVGSETRLAAGVLLMLVNSGLVLGIGAVAYPILTRHHPVTASAYLLTRGFEAALLAVGAVLLLTLVPMADELTASGDQGLAALARVTQEASVHAYWVAMLGLSLGSTFFCRALLRSRLVPRPLAVWGVAGYLLLAVGSVLQLLGTELGLLMSVPGGLFEATLGVLLLVKGFPEVQSQDEDPDSAPVPAALPRTLVQV